METHPPPVRIAALGDLHCSRASAGEFQPLFVDIAANADILVLCGDLTNLGLPDEARVLAKEMAPVTNLPVLAVLGNHDFESGHEEEIVRILADTGVSMLDGDGLEVRGVGFAGVKGFGGGFGQHTLEPWGESAIKQFVQEAIGEAMKLGSALARLRTQSRIVLLHYAPIQATVEGEPPAVFPFLGSSRLEDPLMRYPVDAVFHGHAHHGTPQGETRDGAPVYNVALPLLRDHSGDKHPFKIIEVPVGATGIRPDRVTPDRIVIDGGGANGSGTARAPIPSAAEGPLQPGRQSPRLEGNAIEAVDRSAGIASPDPLNEDEEP